MFVDLSVDDLGAYTMQQIDRLFPDGKTIEKPAFGKAVRVALERLEYCFERIALPGYTKAGQAQFDHLHADQYCSYLYFLSNSVYEAGWDVSVAKKLYALNKALNGINCLYDTKLPDIICIVHGVGAVLGKATYKNYLVVAQNVTICAVSGVFPEMDERLILSAGSAILGNCKIGQNVLLEPYACVLKTDIASNTRVGGQSAPYRLHVNSPRPIERYFLFEN